MTPAEELPEEARAAIEAARRDFRAWLRDLVVGRVAYLLEQGTSMAEVDAALDPVAVAFLVEVDKVLALQVEAAKTLHDVQRLQREVREERDALEADRQHVDDLRADLFGGEVEGWAS